MLTARSAGVWTARLEVDLDGAPIATWKDSGWGGHGAFQLDGLRYAISSPFLGNRYVLKLDDLLVAEAHRPGARRWSVRADGREHHFHRPFMGGGEQQLLVDGQQVGYVRRGGFRDPGLRAELPGMPLPVQVFVLVVIGLVEKRRRSSSDMGGGGGGGGGGDGGG